MPLVPSETPLLLEVEDAVCAVRELLAGLDEALEGVAGLCEVSDDFESDVVGLLGLFGLAIFVAGESPSLLWRKFSDGFVAIVFNFEGVCSLPPFAGVPVVDAVGAAVGANEVFDAFLDTLLGCGDDTALVAL